MSEGGEETTTGSARGQERRERMRKREETEEGLSVLIVTEQGSEGLSERERGGVW